MSNDNYAYKYDKNTRHLRGIADQEKIQEIKSLIIAIHTLRKYSTNDLILVLGVALGGQSYPKRGIDNYIRKTILQNRHNILIIHKRGRDFFYNTSEELHKIICDDFGYCEKIRQIKTDPLETVFLMDLIHDISEGLNQSIWLSAIVTIYLTKMGLDKYCDCPSDNKEKEENSNKIPKSSSKINKSRHPYRV